MSIPAWNTAGLLPAHDALNPVSASRSPYQVSVVDLVLQLANSPERRVIAGGLLRYRAALHAAGFVNGFQWVDGSYCTDIETLEGRPPQDIDVVTFLESPEWMDRNAVAVASPELFFSDEAKQQFSCDAYVVDLRDATAELLISQAAYWSSVWGHTRSGTWKGFLQLDLSPDMDADARDLLDALEMME